MRNEDLTGAERLQILDCERVRVADELQSITDDELAESTRIQGEDFNHREWLGAEFEALQDEFENTRSVVSLDGTVNY